MRLYAVVLSALTGCSFGGHPITDADPTDPDGPRSDADPNAPDARPGDIAHLGPATEAMLTSTVDLTLPDGTTINTTNGTISGNPAGVIELVDVPQEGGGPAVMVIQARSIVVEGSLTVRGDRPLVIVATTTLVVDGAIDASAELQGPGPGGSVRTMGTGAGTNGSRGTGVSDCGASGGSFGSTGGAGGDVAGMPGPGGGPLYGSAAVLAGGSGGGNGAPATCNSFGGGGGGALQLSAGTSITIAGSIDAGGGGGFRGLQCDAGAGLEGASGGGGGSGGMIYLQAPMLLGAGALGANGGGGGAGAGDMGGAQGSDGGDAGLAAGGSAGTNGDPDGGDGGGGASSGVDAAPGEDVAGANDNTGGGGGGVGRIYYDAPSAGAYVASPAGQLP